MRCLLSKYEEGQYSKQFEFSGFNEPHKHRHTHYHEFKPCDDCNQQFCIQCGKSKVSEFQWDINTPSLLAPYAESHSSLNRCK